MSFKKYTLFTLLLLFIEVPLMSQSLRIINMELKDQKFFINYEIDDANPNNEYLVKVYSAADNYSAPLVKVSGDVGEEVKPGNRSAVWSITEELGDYVGSLSIELRASVFIPFVRVRNFSEKGKYKRGKSADIEWKPGNTNPIHIELYKENNRLQGELNYPNNGSYTVNFNKDLKPGADYRIKITDSRKPEDFIYTTEFKIKRKIPLLLMGIPALGIGYFLYTLVGAEGLASTLPGPVDLPEN